MGILSTFALHLLLHSANSYSQVRLYNAYNQQISKIDVPEH